MSLGHGVRGSVGGLGSALCAPFSACKAPPGVAAGAAAPLATKRYLYYFNLPRSGIRLSLPFNR